MPEGPTSYGPLVKLTRLWPATACSAPVYSLHQEIDFPALRVNGSCLVPASPQNQWPLPCARQPSESMIPVGSAALLVCLTPFPGTCQLAPSLPAGLPDGPCDTDCSWRMSVATALLEQQPQRRPSPLTRSASAHGISADVTASKPLEAQVHGSPVKAAPQLST